MKIGLYGYQGAGATTLFNALTGLEAQTGYGGGKGVNKGIVKVPDPRIDRLAEIYRPKRTVYAEMLFMDFPPPPPGTTGLTNVDEARRMDMLALVVKGFTDEATGEKSDPALQLEELLGEMVLTDQDQFERYVQRRKKMKKDPSLAMQDAAVEKALAHLEQGLSLRTLEWSEDELRALRSFAPLTVKPALVAVNVDEDEVGSELPPEVHELAARHGLEVFKLSARVEEEISRLEPDEQREFLEDMGLDEPLSARFIRAAFSLMDLISFFTVGEDEVRAWPIPRGTNAKAAAGAIHSDLERGFIRAEVFHYDDLMAAGGDENEVKKQGKLRLEGKDYIVKDGDILHIRFNV